MAATFGIPFWCSSVRLDIRGWHQGRVSGSGPDDRLAAAGLEDNHLLAVATALLIYCLCGGVEKRTYDNARTAFDPSRMVRVIIARSFSEAAIALDMTANW